jgi:hypothetical protein
VSVDATPILTAAVTGITGVLGGLLGYQAARQQGKVELERIKLDRDRLNREKKKAEVAKKEKRAKAATAPEERERAKRELQSARAELRAITDLGPAGRTSAMI